MKTYQKPIMIALSLTGNEQLCGTCASKGGQTLYNDLDLAARILDWAQVGLGSDNKVGRDDFANLFGSTDSPACSTKVDGYCKFTSTDGFIVAWS